MIQVDERPELHFFRSTPDALMSRPPLCSSLQTLESCFFLIALGRFPHALVTCASSVESAIKSRLKTPPERFINAEHLFANALDLHPELVAFDKRGLEEFRFMRNRIVHYGFSPRDDEETATLLLRTGFPFLKACYSQFFGFDLLDGLVVEFAEQLEIALDVYDRARHIDGITFSYCFSAFGHLIRWRVRQSLMADWENDAAEYAEEIGMNFDRYGKTRDKLEQTLGTTWFFDCPICAQFETFVCELDEDQLNGCVVSLKRGVCASCGLVVPRRSPFLADALCRDQVASNHSKILREYGIKGV